MSTKSVKQNCETVAKCLICGDRGWVCHNVPVGDPEFGQAFRCSCVAEQDAKDMAARRLAASNLPHPATPRTLANFEVSDDTAQAFEAACVFGGSESLVRCLTLTGNYGTGKSHLLEAIGRNFLEEGKRVRYELCADLLKNCRAGFSPRSDVEFHVLWDKYIGCDLLILDDLGGMDQQTPWGTGILSSLVDERYRNEKYLAIGTNMTMDEVARTIDERVADRLWDAKTGESEVVGLMVCSYRTGKK